MIKFELEGKTYSVPAEWKDVQMCDYEKWFNHRPESQLDYVKLVAGICKIDADLLLNSPADVFDTLVDKIRFMFDTENVFEPVDRIVIDNQAYCLQQGTKLTLGEWVDVESILESDSESKVSEMLAVVCRPVGEAYNVDKCEVRKELFRRQTCDKLLPLLAFFLDRKKRFDATMSLYSQTLEAAARFARDTRAFAESGDGIKRLPIWQRIRYIFLMKSLERVLSKFSGFSSTR